MIVAIDAGNTRIKWGVHDGTAWIDSCARGTFVVAAAKFRTSQPCALRMGPIRSLTYPTDPLNGGPPVFDSCSTTERDASPIVRTRLPLAPDVLPS